MYRAGANLGVSMVILVLLCFVLTGPCRFGNVLRCWDVEG